MRRKGKRALALFLTLVVITTMTLGGAMATSAENQDPADWSQSEIGETAVDEQAETKGETPDTVPAGETVPATEQTTETQEATDASTEAPVTEAPVTEAAENGTETGTETPTEAQPTTETPSPSSEAASEVTTETATEAATEGLTEQESAADEVASEKETQKESLVQQMVKASGSGASAVTLSGMMPEGASAKAVPVNVEIEGQTVLAAYDITIYDRDGKEFQPEQGSIRVEIADVAVQEAVAQAEDISVFHMENAQAAPEAVANEKVDAAGSTVAFEAEHFSIYVVTTPDSHYTHTYNFYNDGELLSTQILSTGETLQRPASPDAGDHQVFTGWYTKEEGGTAFTTFDETEGTLNANATTDLYAQFKTAYYVYYMSEDGSRVIFTQTYVTNGAEIVTDPAKNYFATEAGKALIGWSEKQNVSDPDSNLKIGGADVTLYPVVGEAKWITYDSQGGTPVDPAYVLTGKNTVEPTAPTRMGYSFNGWYTEAGCTTEFTFGKALDSDITLYAGWREAAANYTVIIWQQKVTDGVNAETKTYDYVESHTVKSTTGAAVNASAYTNLAYTGFYYAYNDSDGMTVAADGSTILNVYYNRQVITLNFGTLSRSNGSNKYTVSTTLIGLYGAQITGWPNDKYWWYSNFSYDSYWGYSYDGTRTTFLDTFTPPSISADNQNSEVTVEYYGFERNSKQTLKFYTQNLDRNTYTEAKSVNSNSTEFNITDKFTGFTAYGYKKNNSSNIVQVGELMKDGKNYYYDADTTRDGYQGVSMSGVSTLYVYFNRNTYKIDYKNGSDTVHTDSYLYEESLEGKTLYSNSDMTYPGTDAEKGWYEFEGWYADPECTVEFTLPKTMPANNLVAYAKWVPKTVTVTFDLGYEAEDIKTIWTEKINIGSRVEEPNEPRREGYTFAGWLRNGEPFNFGTQITENTNLVALWISSEKYQITYDAGTGTGDNVTDSTGYAEGSQAMASDVPESWKAPENSSGFLYWIDGDGTVYYPGDSIIIGNADITLTAIWADSRSTALTYNFNGGTYTTSDGKTQTELTVTINTPNSEYAIEGYTPTRSGYKFLGWTLASDGTGELLEAGYKIQVDTLNPETNVLYAKWAQVYTVTVKKIVSGNMGDTVSETVYSFNYSVKESGAETANGTLSIKHNGSDTIADIVSGSEVTITEIGTNEAGYKTYVQVDNGDQVEKSSETITVTGDTTVIFYNEKNIVPPTGLANRVLPAVVMTLLALAGAVYLFIAARRRRNAW